MNVPFQICSFIDVVCELVADFSCFFHCLVYCFGLIAFCTWFNKGQAAWYGLAWLPVVCENLASTKEAAQCFRNYLCWMESQNDIDPVQLMLLRDMMDFAM